MASPFVETLGENFGYVSSLEEANKLIEDLETRTTAKFACFKATKSFGSFNHTGAKHRIFWEDNQHVLGAKISFTGVPFLILGSKAYDCQHGVDRNTALKRRMREEISLNTEFIRKKTSKKLRDALKAGTATPERRIYIEFPSDSDHTNHLVGEEGGKSLPVDKRVINRIHELVSEGLTNVNQVKNQLDFFVKAVLFRDKELPQTTNRRFYPTTKDIYTHIYRAKVKSRESSQGTSTPTAKQSSSLSNTINASSSMELPIEDSFNETIADNDDEADTALCSDTEDLPSEEFPSETNVALTNNTNEALPSDIGSLVELPNNTGAALPGHTRTALPDGGEGQKCRETLEQVRQLTFVIKDEEMLGRLNSYLQDVVEQMRLGCSSVRQCSDHDYVLVAHDDNSTLQRDTLLTLNLVNNN